MKFVDTRYFSLRDDGGAICFWIMVVIVTHGWPVSYAFDCRCGGWLSFVTVGKEAVEWVQLKTLSAVGLSHRLLRHCRYGILAHAKLIFDTDEPLKCAKYGPYYMGSPPLFYVL